MVDTYRINSAALGLQPQDSRLPTARAERYAFAEQIGQDGHRLLRAVFDQAPDWMRHIPAIETLRQVWVQQFHWIEGVLRWREAGHLPPASHMIYSPYDVEARYGKKRDTEWKGYQVHLTECCDPELPLVITDVQTTAAATTDFEVLPAVQADLAERHLLILPRKCSLENVGSGFLQQRLDADLQPEFL